MIEDRPFVPKPNVTFPEGYGASWAGIRRRSVFTNAKEVEECDQHHVGDGSVVLCEVVFCSDCADGGNWYGELGLGGRILIVKSFQNSCNGEVKGMLGWGSSTGVGMSVQNIFLCDTAERDSNGVNFDLTSEAELSFPHGNSKCEEHVSNVCWGLAMPAMVVGVELAVLEPRFPVAGPGGAVHRRRSNRLPRSVSKTLDFSQIGTIASRHRCCVGRGKTRSKARVKSRSESVGVWH